MSKKDTDRIVTGAFDIGVVLKGIDGVIEIAGGLLLLVIPLSTIRHLLVWVTGRELSEGLREGLPRRHAVPAPAVTYPVAIVVFATFSVYQVYQYTFSHSLLLALLTVLDVAVIVLTVWAYWILLRRGREVRLRAPTADAGSGRARRTRKSSSPAITSVVTLTVGSRPNRSSA